MGLGWRRGGPPEPRDRRDRLFQPTRSQLVAVRGTDFGEMFNGIVGWHIAMDGKVTYLES
jgi:hypothetical protein